MWGSRAGFVLNVGFLAGWLLFCEGQAQAAVFFDDSFEGATPEASGWIYAQGWCYYNAPRSNPCPEIDLSTDIAYAGSKSIKATYKAEWSDPNPQTHDQAISRKIPSTKDIYVRYYYRTKDFTYTAASSTKQLYYKNNGGYSPTFVSNFFWGSRELGMGVQIMAGICPTSAKGPNDNCVYTANRTSVPLQDNRWYCIEEHINLGSPGKSDGTVELWVDGIQTIGFYNQGFLGTGTGSTYVASALSSFETIQIYKQNGDGIKYFDQFAVGNTRIGCTAGSSPQDSTPPASPTGLTLR